MPILVHDRYGLAARVRAALRELCPAFDIEVVKQRIAAGSTPQHGKTCTHYEARRATHNVLIRLIESHVNTSIIYSQSGGYYRFFDNTIRWSPREWGTKDCASSKEPTPPRVILAHELIHAYHDLLRPTNTEPAQEETFAVRGENQVRHEINLAPRTCYGGTVIPSATKPDPTIRTGDLFGCSSPTVDTLEFASGVRVWRQLHLSPTLQRISPEEPASPSLEGSNGRARQARWTIDNDRAAMELRQLDKASQETLLVEAVAPERGTYRGARLDRFDDRVELSMNFELEELGDALWVSPPVQSVAVSLELANPTEFSTFFERLANTRTRPPSGSSGFYDQVWGGTTFALSHQGEQVFSVYGRPMPLFDTELETPRGDDADQARYEFFSDFYTALATNLARG